MKLIFAAAALVLITYASPITPTLAATDPYAPILRDSREDVIERTDGEISAYALNLTLDPVAGTLSGTQRVEFVNHTGESQLEVPFRLYPNAGYYDDGELAIEVIRVEGERVTPAFSEQDTVMTVPLPEPLPPDATTTISMRYTVTVPVDSTGTFGIFSRDAERGTWILADWYPILAGWEDGSGWRGIHSPQLAIPPFPTPGSMTCRSQCRPAGASPRLESKLKGNRQMGQRTGRS